MKKLLICLLLVVGCGPAEVVHRDIPGPVGPSGAPGATGATGATGAQGPAGVNSSSQVSVVQLCKSCSPAYPSVFPEVALCINNDLYGVYSVPGAYMTFITPGVYTSAGVGCTCTLTVLANCQVTSN